MNYLNDFTFLQELDNLKIRVSYARLVLLDYNEEPIREIQGTITGGSITVNGSSAVRRTLNGLQVIAKLVENNLTDINNEISANKKIKVEIGLKNPLKKYQHYGDIIWFPCGIYLISSASISRSTSGWNISLTGKDKMCLLDGTCGGMLPATTVFDSMYDENGVNVKIPIEKIIREAVNHLGNEKLENIIINDLDIAAKRKIAYRGQNDLLFNEDYTDFIYKPESEEKKDVFGYPNEVTYGIDFGYRETPLIYSGELVMNAGEPITNLLKKIADALGNFEYFYDLDGKFVFQEKKNYLNTQSPFDELVETDYLRSYSNTRFVYSLTDLSTVSSININPKYDNIKNDFVVWGKKETASGAEVGIRYHLVIDEKPQLDRAKKYMWAVYPDNNVEIPEGQIENYSLLIRYEFTDNENNIPEGWKLRGKPCEEWREELYRLSLMARKDGKRHSVYDEELIAEWRKIFDTSNPDWEKEWEELKYGKWQGWNPAVKNNPESLDYWLDFIGANSSLGYYSVNQIGRRAKIVADSGAKTLYNAEVPDILFVFESDYIDNSAFSDAIREYQNKGQKVYGVTLNSIEQYLFDTSSTEGASCFDYVRELLYQHLSYNITISLTCFPRYYFEPNQLIYLNDIESNVIGNYAISQFTLPLTYNGTMSLTLTEALQRI